MKLKRYGFKLLTVTLSVVTITVLMFNFDSIFTDLSCKALTFSANKSDKTELPTKINFLDDDRNLFIKYCKGIYGEDLPIKIDDSIYKYYGTVNGYRFYRIQPTLIPYDSIIQHETIGGYTFESPSRFRPEPTGLYIIGDDSVYTLNEAYSQGIIDIKKAYRLYKEKNLNY